MVYEANKDPDSYHHWKGINTAPPKVPANSPGPWSSAGTDTCRNVASNVEMGLRLQSRGYINKLVNQKLE